MARKNRKKRKERKTSSLYVVSDGEQVFCEDQVIEGEMDVTISLKQARKTLENLETAQGFLASDDVLSPLHIYELKLVE